MLVVDASVAVKWVLPEADSQRAIALCARGVPLTAPSLLIEEAANVVWQRVRRAELTRDQAIDAVRVAIGLMSTIVPVGNLYEDALRLAVDLDHPVYDCFYIAIALRNQAPLATADRKMSVLATRAGVLLDPWATSPP
jgi:predicted nucleic acid-binding protein